MIRLTLTFENRDVYINAQHIVTIVENEGGGSDLEINLPIYTRLSVTQKPATVMQEIWSEAR